MADKTVADKLLIKPGSSLQIFGRLLKEGEAPFTGGS